MRECDHGRQGVKHRVQPIPCRHERPSCHFFPCSRFARQDATCDRDCCNCVSLSPVTATPQRFDACAICASRRRSGTDNLPWIYLIRFTRPLDFSSRARRTAVDTRFPDAKSIPRLRSAHVACTPRGANRNCSFARTETELLRTLDFVVAISHPACVSFLAMQVIASSSSCATRLWSPKRCSEISSTTTRMDTVGCAERTSRSGPTNSNWRSVVAKAHPGMIPHCAFSVSPATPSCSTCRAAW